MAVESVFERIQQDERHGEVTVLEFAASETRDFGEWSIAHVAPWIKPYTDAGLVSAELAWKRPCGGESRRAVSRRI